MKLMQWLAVGRSLGKVRDDRNRYKLPEQALLPRFGPNAADEQRRNSRPAATATATDATAAATAANERNAMSTVEISASAVSEMSGGAGSQTAGRTAASQPAATSVQKFPLGRWSVFRNPFATAAKAAKAPKPAKAAGQVRAPVQGELLLDLVKPVRNDLADSDLVVVAASAPDGVDVIEAKAAAELAAPVTELAAPVEPAGPEPVWNRIKTQFFGAEKE